LSTFSVSGACPSKASRDTTEDGVHVASARQLVEAVERQDDVLAGGLARTLPEIDIKQEGSDA
jgi:hypothetical protein